MAGKGMDMNNMQAMMMQMMMKGKGKGGGKWSNSDQFFDKISEADAERKVYVEGLPDGANWRDLQKHCTDAGKKPGLCEVMKGGRGVLVFKDALEATEAITALDQTKMGESTITTDAWTKKDKSDDKPQGGGKGGKGGKGDKGGWGKWDDSKNTLAKIRQMEDDKKVYVEGLPDGATWKDLDSHFAEAGHKPGLCEVMKSGRGVLLFKDASAAKAAIKGLSQSTMGGSTITTDKYTSKQGGDFGGCGGGWGGCDGGFGDMGGMWNVGGKGGGWGGWGGDSGGCGGVMNKFGSKGQAWGGHGANQPPQDLGATCVVSNIPDGIGQEEFKENLESAGKVKSARFVGGGRAFVSFATTAEADKCVQMFNGCDVGGVSLEVHRGKK